MKILVLGATGMLGSAMFRVLSQSDSYPIVGTARNSNAKRYFTKQLADQLITISDLENHTQLTDLLDTVKPDVVINCVALSRDLFHNPEKMISIFSLLPRRLAHLCSARNIRLVQISSDGVFSGIRGDYSEDDLPDATDSYGVAKLLGEVEGPHCLTLRTSILGPELSTQNGLLAWFLQQGEKCYGYTGALFSGFPAVVLSQIVRDIVLPNNDLQGIYHVASKPISKFDLLSLVAQTYNSSTHIIPDDSVVIDRTLCADRFNQKTGLTVPEWPEMIRAMYSYNFGLREN